MFKRVRISDAFFYAFYQLASKTKENRSNLKQICLFIQKTQNCKTIKLVKVAEIIKMYLKFI